mgnify:CR=1 FL=1
MRNEESKYCISDYSERLANIIKDQVQVTERLDKALMIQDSVFVEINNDLKALLFDMLGVEETKLNENVMANINECFFRYCEDKMTFDQFMKVVNDQIL